MKPLNILFWKDDFLSAGDSQPILLAGQDGDGLTLGSTWSNSCPVLHPSPGAGCCRRGLGWSQGMAVLGRERQPPSVLLPDYTASPIPPSPGRGAIGLHSPPGTVQRGFSRVCRPAIPASSEA